MEDFTNWLEVNILDWILVTPPNYLVYQVVMKQYDLQKKRKDLTW